MSFIVIVVCICVSEDPEDDYEGLDPDIELEMEAFIDEIEEHLMMQDFDPELHQEPEHSDWK